MIAVTADGSHSFTYLRSHQQTNKLISLRDGAIVLMAYQSSVIVITDGYILSPYSGRVQSDMIKVFFFFSISSQQKGRVGLGVGNLNV